MVKLLGSGREYGLEFTFRVQERREELLKPLVWRRIYSTPSSDSNLEIIFSRTFRLSLPATCAETGAKILLKQVEQPQRFGVVELEGNRITD